MVGGIIAKPQVLAAVRCQRFVGRLQVLRFMHHLHRGRSVVVAAICKPTIRPIVGIKLPERGRLAAAWSAPMTAFIRTPAARFIDQWRHLVVAWR